VPHVSLLPLLLVVFWPVAPEQVPAANRQLGCGVFRPGMTRVDLVEMFGEPAISDGLIPVGEGVSQPGTTVFAGTPDHLEVFWNERGGRRTVTSVIVRVPASTWSSTAGIRIGVDLREIERLNGGPFRLMGLGWDYEGTTMSWSEGALAGGDTARCRLRLRLRPDRPDERPEFYQQVTGTREFGSDHPAMQELNPRVYEMWLEFGRF
jgi:hypothetical protein